MKKIPSKTLRLFRQWGARGGEKRAGRMTAAKRSAIAKQAARARWGGKSAEFPSMTSVRLDEASWKNPVYLEEVLLHGDLNTWRQLRRILHNHPFGAEAAALGKVLAATQIYGTTSLWKGLLKRFRGDCS